jgi:hypothetical protein
MYLWGGGMIDCTREVLILSAINIASQEIGYIEKKTNKDLDEKESNIGSGNWTKYARDIMKSKNGYPWCAVFVNWIIWSLFGHSLIRLTAAVFKPSAGCQEIFNIFGKNESIFQEPMAGDFVIFQRAKGKTFEMYHIGFVIETTDTHFTTIEGNTSPQFGVVENGGMVCKKTYPLTYNRIGGFARPDYVKGALSE